MPQYQRKIIRDSGIVRPRYGILRSGRISGSSSKTFTFHNCATEDECTEANEIYDITRPDSSVNDPNLHIAFTSLYAKVEFDGQDDGSRVLLQID